jgi:hypothetical protein
MTALLLNDYITNVRQQWEHRESLVSQFLDGLFRKTTAER